MKITLRYVTERVNKDGSVRYYFRRRGQTPVRISGDPGTVEFAEDYQRLLRWSPAADTVKEGTFSWLCDIYMDSPEFQGRASATKIARARIIRSMIVERIDPDHPEIFGQEMIRHFTRAHIITLRDRKASVPNAANERLKILGQIMKVAVARGFLEHSPVHMIERLLTRKGGHATATDEHIVQYFAHHTPGTTAHRAMIILRATGMRVSDLRVIGRPHVKTGSLRFSATKNDVLVEQPASPELIEAMSHGTDLIAITNDWGRPFKSDKAMSQRVSKWFRQAGIEGITAHSVRKWLATKMAESGATEYELMAWFGWRDPKEARPYIEKANRARLAQSASDKWDNVKRLEERYKNVPVTPNTKAMK